MNLIENQGLNRASYFQTALSFQSNGIECSKKVNGVDIHLPIAKQCDIKSDQIEAGNSKMEEHTSGCMSKKRYTDLIRMASGKFNQVSCKKTADRVGQAELR